MAGAGLILSVIGTGVSLISGMAQASAQRQQGKQQAAIAEAQGRAQQRAAEYEAAQFDVKAKSDRAAAVSSAQEQLRKAAIVESNAMAAAGASGGGSSDPTVVKIMGDIAKEGSYRSRVAMFQGEDSARSNEDAAALRRYEGETAKQGAYATASGYRSASENRASSTMLDTFGSVFSSGSSLYDKYWSGSSTKKGA